MTEINNNINNIPQNSSFIYRHNKENGKVASNNPEKRVNQNKDRNVNTDKVKNSKRNKNERYFKPPLVIDSSNNMFYITHNGKSEMILIDEGEYTLTDLRVEILSKVDQTYGAGKISLDLIGSGSDKVVNAKKNKDIREGIKIPKEDKILSELVKKEKEGKRILVKMEDSIIKMRKQIESIKKLKESK